jgi:hypothetical protein
VLHGRDTETSDLDVLVDPMGADARHAQPNGACQRAAEFYRYD